MSGALGREMGTPLLATKLTPPQPRPGALARPHLTARLAAGARGRLTLLAAPAGSGKSTILAAWLAEARSAGQAAAWLALDAADGDPARFWRYTLAALDGALPGVAAGALALLSASETPPAEVPLTTLLNALAADGREVALVLDDYHAIAAPAIHAGLAFLVANLPPNGHVVIASRADPPLPLARWRARGELTELRAADLRFGTEEAAALLAGQLGWSPDRGVVSALAARTEGWVAGLQLAGLALRDQRDPAAFAAAFAGSHRYVVDFLAEEVLAHLDAPRRDFLLQTAILDRLTGPVCDAVTGREDGEATLAGLAAANLFIVPLDDERRWYRYHHLFADVLRQFLSRARQGDEVAALHRRASAWFAAHGLADEAISHALSAGEAEGAATLIAGNVRATLERGEHDTLRRWLAALPAALLRARAPLAIAAAWSRLVRGETEGVAEWLDAAETAPDGAAMAGEIAALRAGLLLLRDAPASADAARRALVALPQRDHFLRGMATLTLGTALWLTGDLGGATRALDGAAALGERTGMALLAVLATTTLASLRERQGRLGESARLSERALAWVSDREGQPLPIPTAAQACTMLGAIAYARDDLDAAERRLEQAVAIGERWPASNFTWPAYLVLARLRRARGDVAGARAMIDEADRRAAQTGQAYAIAPVAYWRAALGLADSAGSAPSPGDRSYGEYRRRAQARALLAAGALPEATDMIERLVAEAERGGEIHDAIELRVLLAVAYQAGGNEAAALAALERALALAAPEGYLRLFADEGEPVAALLARLLGQWRAGRRTPPAPALPAHAERALAAFGPARATSPAATTAAPLPMPPAATSADEDLVETLSSRELDVLRLVAEGRANKEIARALAMAEGTVKVHLRNIYGKLATTSRTGAVARARAVGLLP